jgi:flavin-dependent dehydrogenase
LPASTHLSNPKGSEKVDKSDAISFHTRYPRDASNAAAPASHHLLHIDGFFRTLGATFAGCRENIVSLMNDWADLFVVGGGPAGLAVAIAASRKGMRVTVADGAVPPIDKTCGEGMMPETQEALGEVGVSLDPSDGFRFKGVRFIQEGTSVSGNFPAGHGLGLARPLLHERMLVRARECGVRLLWNTPVTAIEPEAVLARGRKIRARWIVGADGLASRVRRWGGLEPAHSRSLRFASRRHYRLAPWSDFVEIHWGRRVQAYVTPIAGDEVSVVMIGDGSKDAEFERALAALPDLRERLRQAEPAGRERGAVTSSRSLKDVRRGNVALLGDASGSVDAITGEGLRLALLQALALVDSIAAGTLERYQSAHRALEKRPLLMARWMVLLGRHDLLRRRVIRSFADKPELFAKFLAFHVGHGTSAELLTTGAALGWQLLAA